MGTENPRFDRYFDRDTPWKAEKIALRRIVLAHPLTEELKWRQPVYCWQGANVAMIAGFKDRCALSFFKGALLSDPGGILEKPGANSRSARIAAFTAPGQIAARAGLLHACLTEAIANEAAGRKPDLQADDLALPSELADALDADAGLRAAWQGLTQGRRRGWILHVAAAKQPATRTRRVHKAAPAILSGKGPHDR